MPQPDTTLTTLIEHLESLVKQARKAGDIPPLLTLTARALDQLEQAAARPDITPADRQRAQNTARKLGYNAAADAWPFWDAPPPTRTAKDLKTARAIALRAAAVTAALPHNPKQLGNAAWLIGAFDFALGDLPSAQTNFAAARAHFADFPEMKLLAEGYLARAGGQETAPLETTIQTLKNANFPHAAELAEQLVTAEKASKQALLF